MIAIITGVTGQDGSYLSEFLLDKGYVVYGLNRRTSSKNTGRLVSNTLEHPNFKLLEYDITDSSSLARIFESVPEHLTIEVYNLAAQSHVLTSFSQPEMTSSVNAIGCLKVLEAIRNSKLKNVKFYQASTSELYGKVCEIPQTEETPFYPRSPYGVSKLFAHWIVKNYRESYGMFACSGILFNHESERRGCEFVTRKITIGVAKSLKDHSFRLRLGNLDSRRDWGHAIDYVRGMWLMLQQPVPDDYVLATGTTRTVREFVTTAFAVKDICIYWMGEGIDEKGYDAATGRCLVEVDPKFYRPAEVDILVGNASKASKLLNWKPNISFEELIKRMVENDYLNNTAS
jgi:GDPmannose 4,6-dehydratase